jgi:outer membrane protein TolC
MKRTHFTLLLALGVTGLFLMVTGQLVRNELAREPPRRTLNELIDVAVQVNPQVRAARERWLSASHQIQQNYAPADPIFSYSNVESPNFPLYKSSFAHDSGHAATAVSWQGAVSS